MMWLSPLAVGIGGFVGALLRWGLGLALNPIFPTVPLGTLVANLLGGFLIGLLMALFTQYQVLPPWMPIAPACSSSHSYKSLP